MAGDMLIYAVPVILVVVLLFLGVALLNRADYASETTRLPGTLLGRDELVLFKALREGVGEKCSIYPKVSLAAISLSKGQSLDRVAAYAPFVLCDPGSTMVLLAIELSGTGNAQLEASCRQIGLPLLSISRAKSYDPAQLATQIAGVLDSNGPAAADQAGGGSSK